MKKEGKGGMKGGMKEGKKRGRLWEGRNGESRIRGNEERNKGMKK